LVKAAQLFVGTRKEAVARLMVVPGHGRVYINGVPVELYGNEIAREKILTPLRLDDKFVKTHDFKIKVEGGGIIGQADACAMAIARALAAHSEGLKSKILQFNRYLLAGDPRRTEPKKPNRRSARRFKQKSYR
jgi:small subunit ribosomal protein S9